MTDLQEAIDLTLEMLNEQARSRWDEILRTDPPLTKSDELNRLTDFYNQYEHDKCLTIWRRVTSKYDPTQIEGWSDDLPINHKSYLLVQDWRSVMEGKL